MRGVAFVGDLIAHPRQQLEGSPVAKLGIEFAFEYVKDVPEIAPVVRQIPGAVFHLANPQITDREVRQMASPVSPGCTVGATADQSVTVNGSAGICIFKLSRWSELECWLTLTAGRRRRSSNA